MSVFGGDSWAREAQYRKRKVDDLLLDGVDAASYKKLSNGKFACLVCRSNPTFDSPLMLSMHCKGLRHHSAESKLKEKEFFRLEEMRKRMALPGCSNGSGTNIVAPQPKFVNKPPQKCKAVSGTLDQASPRKPANRSGIAKSNEGCSTHHPSNIDNHDRVMEATSSNIEQAHLDFYARRERELKFIAAGWKRDCNGGWYRDENVEFDSDEEDPNLYYR